MPQYIMAAWQGGLLHDFFAPRPRPERLFGTHQAGQQDCQGFLIDIIAVGNSLAPFKVLGIVAARFLSVPLKIFGRAPGLLRPSCYHTGILFVILSAAKNLSFPSERFFTPLRSVQNDRIDINFLGATGYGAPFPPLTGSQAVAKILVRLLIFCYKK